MGISNVLYAQVDTSNAAPDDQKFNRFNEIQKTDAELDAEINKLLNEINNINTDDVSHSESIDLFQYALSTASDSLLTADIKRLNQRTDLGQAPDDYIIDPTQYSPDILKKIERTLQTQILEPATHPTVKIILLKSILNIFFIKNQFAAYQNFYNKHKSALIKHEDVYLITQLTQAYLELGQDALALKTAEGAYLKASESVELFYNYMAVLRHNKEFAEMEYYIDNLIVYNDINSLIALATFQYSRGMTAEAESLVYFIEKNITERLNFDYKFNLNTFKWNFNDETIVVHSEPGPLGRQQHIAPDDLFVLAEHMTIYDAEAACRFMKYAYISSFSAKKSAFEVPNFLYLDKKEQDLSIKKSREKSQAIEMLQDLLLKKSC